MSTKIYNPVLPGFNPDPSILRVGEDYYIATSTFEWFPGIQIHHSKDMVNWELIARPVDETLANIVGDPASGGIWAPCLTYDGELYYLVFTDVKYWANDTPYKDQNNYVTTAPSITGPWSEPIYMNSSGFDGSVFHDDDGRKWFLNMEWDHRKKDDDRFSGILLQEIDMVQGKLVGESIKIFPGSDISFTEAPHIYKLNGYYYLMMAEGGTSYGHAVTICRSKELKGPYELSPHHPLITANGKDSYLQKSGHGSFVQDPFGNWYLAYLCGRPLPGTDRCVLGRETSISEITWVHDWPVLKAGGNTPIDYFEVPWDAKKVQKKEYLYTFDSLDFLRDFQTLRAPFDSDVYSLEEGQLVMKGRESIMSCFEQTLVSRRQTDFRFTAETKVTLEDNSFQKMAGLSYRYDESKQYYAYLSYDETCHSKVIELQSVDNGENTFLSDTSGLIQVDTDTVYFKVDVDYANAQFYYSINGDHWTELGGVVDASILSDDYAYLGFTGAFVGMACNDLKDRKSEARFGYFMYCIND